MALSYATRAQQASHPSPPSSWITIGWGPQAGGIHGQRDATADNTQPL